MEFVWQKDDLNDEQVEAITHPGSIFLVACPGSGKTRALTYKVALELSRLGSDKHWVVAITYTHRAADEIEDRISRLGVDTERLWIGTIHAFCLEWIIRPYAIYHDRLKHGFRIIDPHETERRLAELCQGQYPRLSPIDCNYVFTPTGPRPEAPNPERRQQILSVLEPYWAALEEERLVDFEMLLRYAHDLIVSQPTIPKLLSQLFKFVLVDEFQDTKVIQYAILASILKAAAGEAQAFLVGDPNQAIYGSLGGYAMTRGEFAALSGLDLAEKSLSINYRSSERLVTYFSNYHVVPAIITAEGETRTYPSLVSFDDATHHHDVDDEIVRLIRFNIEDRGIAPQQVCVVGPRWVQLAAMTRRLMGALPQYSFDGPGMAEPSPQLFVRRMRWAGEIIVELDNAGVAVGDLTRRELLRLCNSIEIAVDDGLEYLQLFFDELCLALGFELADAPALADHYETFFARSKKQIERLEAADVQGMSEIGMFRRAFAARSGITISTIHGIKGAEFDAVIAFAMLEGMVPHYSDPAGDESAKKLLYVVCSRPRKNLHLIAEAGRFDPRDIPYETTNVLSGCAFAYDVVPDV